MASSKNSSNKKKPTVSKSTKKKINKTVKKAIKKNKGLRVFLIILLIIAIAIVAVLYAEAYRAKTQYMLQNGPFCNEGVWKDPEGKFYLISLYTESETFTDVTAYVCVDGEWEALRADVNQGTNIISFTDGEL